MGRGIRVEEFFEMGRDDCALRLVAGQAGLHRKITEPTVNRPGLALAGFLEYFPEHRVQVTGGAESRYLRSLSPDVRRKRVTRLGAFRVPCFVVARNLHPAEELVELCEQKAIPLFRSSMVTMHMINRATLLLEERLAPEETVQAGMVDIMGIGVLLRGKAGVGKSECALALVERGHSLVADDLTRLRRNQTHQLVGSALESTRYHMEIRGLGIVNVPAMFGISSIRPSKTVELAATLTAWEEMDEVERSGVEQDWIEILGVSVPHVVIPVGPGRDIAHLVEVAALDQRLKAMGYNAAKELDERLIKMMQRGT